MQAFQHYIFSPGTEKTHSNKTHAASRRNMHANTHREHGNGSAYARMDAYFPSWFRTPDFSRRFFTNNRGENGHRSQSPARPRYAPVAREHRPEQRQRVGQGVVQDTPARGVQQPAEAAVEARLHAAQAFVGFRGRLRRGFPRLKNGWPQRGWGVQDLVRLRRY